MILVGILFRYIRNELRDADQIMDDLIPMCRQDGGVLIGDVRCRIPDARFPIWDVRYEICEIKKFDVKRSWLDHTNKL